jgi:TetR/AcrR family transcriptional repressor of nem operon
MASGGPGGGRDVARYDSEHKQATRRRIIESAGRRLKQDGIDGSGIATLMADAGLTNGAFYAHFDSKDDLVAAVVAHELEVQAARAETLPAGRAGLEAYVREYLSTPHRDNAAEGCPAAALLDELGRCSTPSRRAFTEGLEQVLLEIATRLSPSDPASARGVALGLYGSMVGTLQLARAVSDPALAEEILEEGRKHALRLVRSRKRD